MSTKEGKKTRKQVTDGIRSMKKKERGRSSEYQTLKSGEKGSKRQKC